MLSHKLKSLTDLRNNPLLISQLAKDEGPVYILNRNKPVSVLLDVTEYEELLDRIQDTIDVVEIKARMKSAKKTDFVPLEQIEKEYELK